MLTGRPVYHLVYPNAMHFAEVSKEKMKGRFFDQPAHSQSPNNGILKNNCYNTPTSTSQYFLVLGPPEVRRPQYEKILASRGQEASIRENIG